MKKEGIMTNRETSQTIVNEKPMLFSDELVRAIIAGRKTQTRRPITPQPPVYTRCPYGNAGDHLWVRECWRVHKLNTIWHDISVEYRADHTISNWLYCTNGKMFNRLMQQSLEDAGIKKYEAINDCYRWEPGNAPTRWRPSIHMPRWASRLTLEIIGTRMEQIQAITDADILAEGWSCGNDDTQLASTTSEDTRHWFRNTWDAVYAKRGQGWKANPWVWVVEFKLAEIYDDYV